MKKWKILIADDHTMMRDGIRSLIQRNENWEVVGEASNGVDALKLFNRLAPDLTILDISMPEKNGMEVAKTILEHNPEALVLILSMFDDGEYVSKCIELGAKGYVVKSESGVELEEAVTAITAGKTFFSSKAQLSIFDKYKEDIRRRKELESMVKLTNREVEIINLLSQGNTSMQIATRLNISVRTVETHRSNLLKKLGVKNAVELVKKAEELKLF